MLHGMSARSSVNVVTVLIVISVTCTTVTCKCQEITLPECQMMKQFEYSQAIFPNLFGHENQAECTKVLRRFDPLFDDPGCSRPLTFFLCSMVVPVCTVLNVALPPCRGLCIASQDSCAEIIEKTNFKWPKGMDCSTFPVDGLCVAYNISILDKGRPPVKQDKPKFITAPKDVTAIAGKDAMFTCIVQGSPFPHTSWTREGASLPLSRIKTPDDHTLQIEKVTTEDRGRYICTGRNSLGVVRASAKLTVHKLPSFTLTPRNRSVRTGRKVKLQCDATGHPMPAIYWEKLDDETETVMLPCHKHGRLSVNYKNELKIKPIKKEDEGFYTCTAMNAAGSSVTKVYVRVRTRGRKFRKRLKESKISRNQLFHTLGSRQESERIQLDEGP